MPPDTQEWFRPLAPPGDTTPPVGGRRSGFFARLLSAGAAGQYAFVEVLQDPHSPSTWVTVSGGVVGPAAGPGGAWDPGGSTGLATDATAGAGLGLVAWLEPSSGDYAADYGIVGAAAPAAAPSTDFTGKTITTNGTVWNVTGPTTVNGPDTITYSSTSVVNNNGVTNYNSSSTVVQGGTLIQTTTVINFVSTTVNNLTLTGGNTYVFNVIGPTTITGLVPPAGTAPGQNITIQNPTAYPIMVRPSDPGSSPGNRVKPPWGGIVGIPPNGGSIELISGGSGAPWAVDCPCWMPQLYMSVNPTVPLTGDVDDFDPENDCVLPFDPGGVDRKLTGIQGLFDGIQLLIQNVGTLGDLLIPHQDPGSSPANRITTGDGGTIRVQPGGSLAITKTPTLGIVAPRPPLFQTATVYSGWVKVTRTFASFAAAATTNTVPLLTLQAKGIVQSCVVKHSAAFTGGTLTGYLLSSVGHGTPAGTQYFGASGTYAMGGAPLDNGGRYQPVPPTGYAQLQSVTVGTSINATVQSIGGNLNQATAGSVDIWFLIATLP